MTNIIKLLVVSIMVAGFAASFNVNAAQNDSVSCSVVVVGSQPYQANFVVQPGTVFSEEFGSSIFNGFTASTETVSGKTTVTIDYFADVRNSPLDSLEFGTTLTLPNGRGSASANGTTQIFSSPNNFNATADYTLTCRRA
jgi:hypothetical protein